MAILGNFTQFWGANDPPGLQTLSFDERGADHNQNIRAKEEGKAGQC